MLDSLTLGTFGVSTFLRRIVKRIVILSVLHTLLFFPYGPMGNPSLLAQGTHPDTDVSADSVYEKWVTTYNGPGNHDDSGRAIVVDESGNVYVTGPSDGVGTLSDYATIKYDPSGQEEWVTRYNGPSSFHDYAHAIAVDNLGNVYVTGLSHGVGTSSDYATIKYDPSGQEQWVARYDGPASYVDWPAAIAIDGSRNVYVTGQSWGSGTDFDYATIKYDGSGQELWVARYNGPADLDDDAQAIIIDDGGNVYVTGLSYGSGTGIDYATIKYDSMGMELWVARYNGTGNSSDVAGALSIDNIGNVYVTGSSHDSTMFFFDYATIKYNASGFEQWVARFNGPANDHDYASAVAVDGSGNTYVTGRSVTSFYYDYATIKYDASGTEQWIARYDGPGSSGDQATALAVDGSGGVYVAGYSFDPGSFNDYAIVKYDAAGTEQWVTRYNGPGNAYDEALAMAIDGSGNVYVTGQTWSTDTYHDFTTIKFEQAITQVVQQEGDVPKKFSLSQNYPNPFNPATVIRYGLPEKSHVHVEVFNLLGESVALLVDTEQDAGFHELRFDALNLASGVYVYRMRAGDFVETKKLVVLK